MTDDTLSRASPTRLSGKDRVTATRDEAAPRTDVGTIILHWTTAVALIVSLLTGIRIAADDLNTPVSHWLSPILPQGEIWSWH